MIKSVDISIFQVGSILEIKLPLQETGKHVVQVSDTIKSYHEEKQVLHSSRFSDFFFLMNSILWNCEWIVNCDTISALFSNLKIFIWQLHLSFVSKIATLHF